MYPSISLLHGTGKPVEEEGERLQEPEGVKTSKETEQRPIHGWTHADSAQA